MRIVIQRVRSVALTADGEPFDQMDAGILAMVGIESGDISGEFAAAIASQGMKGAKIINCYNCASIHGVYRVARVGSPEARKEQI